MSFESKAIILMGCAYLMAFVFNEIMQVIDRAIDEQEKEEP